MTPRICPNCQAEWPEESSVCPACGAVTAAADETQAFSPVLGAEEAAAEALTTAAGPSLVIKKGPDAGERFSLAADVVTIGRDPGSYIFLNDITVSRRHARIERTGDRFALSDVGSLNGTYVNDERIETYELDDGDRVQIGKFRLVFVK